MFFNYFTDTPLEYNSIGYPVVVWILNDFERLYVEGLLIAFGTVKVVKLSWGRGIVEGILSVGLMF